MSRSIIYRQVWLYRLVMTLLYRGSYNARFERVCALLRDEDRSVLELCFGDVAIAEFCRQNGKAWVGMDVSEAFVAFAERRGFDARRQDVQSTEVFPACDVCIVMGSLYHFEEQLSALFGRIKRASSRMIISEPVRNWTQARGVRGFLARKLTGVGAREERFRFDEASLVRTLDALRDEVGFTYRIVDVSRDMIVEVVWSN